VGQRKRLTVDDTAEWMVVPVEGFTSLCGHAGMTHHDSGIIRDAELELVGRNGPLVDLEPAMGIVGNTGGVGPSGLACSGKNTQNTILLLSGKRVVQVDHTEETAHLRVPPLHQQAH